MSLAVVILFALVLFTEGNLTLTVRQFSIDRSEGTRSFQTVTLSNDSLTKDIIVFFHPWTKIDLKSDGKTFDTEKIQRNYGLDQLVEQSNGSLALVIPIGLEGLMGNNAWNAGAICCQTNSSIDDAGFAAEMVDLITKRPSDYGISSEMNAIPSCRSSSTC